MRILVELNTPVPDPEVHLKRVVAATGAQAVEVEASLPGDARFFSVFFDAGPNSGEPGALAKAVRAALLQATGVASAIPEPDAEI